MYYCPLKTKCAMTWISNEFPYDAILPNVSHDLISIEIIKRFGIPETELTKDIKNLAS